MNKPSPQRGEVAPAAKPPAPVGASGQPQTSKAWAWLGLELVDSGDGWATVQMKPTDDMANASGFVHGGMISTLADTAMGRAIRSAKPGVARAMSFDLKLSFINAAKIGEMLLATGRVIHAGRRTMVARCEVLGREGRLIATGSATFAVSREKGMTLASDAD